MHENIIQHRALEAQEVRLIPVELPTTTEFHQQLTQAKEINDLPVAVREVGTAESWTFPLPQAHHQPRHVWMRAGIHFILKDSSFPSMDISSPSQVLQCSEKTSTWPRTAPGSSDNY